jgi:hypothetical protein
VSTNTSSNRLSAGSPPSTLTDRLPESARPRHQDINAGEGRHDAVNAPVSARPLVPLGPRELHARTMEPPRVPTGNLEPRPGRFDDDDATGRHLDCRIDGPFTEPRRGHEHRHSHPRHRRRAGCPALANAGAPVAGTLSWDCARTGACGWSAA